jgi:hypothetical protein
MKKTSATYYGSVGIKYFNRKNMAHSRYGAHRAPQHNNLPPNPSTLPFDIMPRSAQPGGLAHQMAGCDGCVCWLWVVPAPHMQKFNKILENHGILGINGKLLTSQAKLLHLIKANL